MEKESGNTGNTDNTKKNGKITIVNSICETIAILGIVFSISWCNIETSKSYDAKEIKKAEIQLKTIELQSLANIKAMNAAKDNISK